MPVKRSKSSVKHSNLHIKPSKPSKTPVNRLKKPTNKQASKFHKKAEKSSSKSSGSNTIMDIKTVRHVASVARLKLTKEEEHSLLKDLDEMLSAFSDVQSATAEPSYHPMLVENVFRPDSSTFCLTQDEALSNAKHTERNFFKGPKVM